jgi:hypothetical protein
LFHLGQAEEASTQTTLLRPAFLCAQQQQLTVEYHVYRDRSVWVRKHVKTFFSRCTVYCQVEIEQFSIVPIHSMLTHRREWTCCRTRNAFHVLRSWTTSTALYRPRSSICRLRETRSSELNKQTATRLNRQTRKSTPTARDCSVEEGISPSYFVAAGESRIQWLRIRHFTRFLSSTSTEYEARMSSNRFQRHDNCHSQCQQPVVASEYRRIDAGQSRLVVDESANIIQ